MINTGLIVVGILIAEGETGFGSAVLNIDLTLKTLRIVILMIRTYALWERKRSILIFLIVLGVVSFLYKEKT